MPVKLFVVSIWSRTKVLRHLPAKQFPKSEESFRRRAVLIEFFSNRLVLKNLFTLINNLFCISELDKWPLFVFLYLRMNFFNCVRFDFFISEVGLFVLHSLKVFDIALPLTHIETLDCESIVNFFVDYSLVWRSDHYFSFLVYANFDAINHVRLVIKQYKALVFGPFDH